MRSETFVTRTHAHKNKRLFGMGHFMKSNAHAFVVVVFVGVFRSR